MKATIKSFPIPDGRRITKFHILNLETAQTFPEKTKFYFEKEICSVFLQNVFPADNKKILTQSGWFFHQNHPYKQKIKMELYYFYYIKSFCIIQSLRYDFLKWEQIIEFFYLYAN